MFTVPSSDIRSTLWPTRLVQVRRTLNRSSRIIVFLGLISLTGNAVWIWQEQYATQTNGQPVDHSDWFHPSYMNSLLIAVIMLYAMRQISRTRQKLTPLGYPLLERIEHHRGRDVWRSVEPLTKRPAHLHVVYAGKYPLEEMSWKEISHQWIKRGDKVKKLTSPHIARLLDCGFAQSESFYAVMELPRGMTLHDFIGRHGACPPDRSIYLLAQIAHAIQDAHTMGLCNLSLRPQHVWIGFRTNNADWITVELFGYEENDTAEHLTRIDICDYVLLAIGLLTGRWVEDRDNPNSISAAIQELNRMELPYMFKQHLSRYCTAGDDEAIPPADELARRLWSSLSGPSWNNDRAQAWWKVHGVSEGEPE